MALINQLVNTANITVDGVVTNSNPVTTLLSLPPTVLKSVDKAIAKIGETIKYTVAITNVNLSAMNDVGFADTLPAGCQYVADSFKVNNTAVTPTITAGKISYTIPTIAIAGTATVTFQVTAQGGNI